MLEAKRPEFLSEIYVEPSLKMRISLAPFSFKFIQHAIWYADYIINNHPELRERIEEELTEFKKEVGNLV